MSIKVRILVPMIAVAIITATLILVSNIIQLTMYVDSTIETDLDRALLKIKSEIDLMQDKAAAASLYFSNDSIIIDEIKNNNREGLANRAISIFTDTGIEIGAITDAKGNVLSRPYDPDNYGDDLSKMYVINSAINGQATKATESGPTIDMMACAGAPIFDEHRQLIGAVAIGFRLDTQQFVDRHKEIAGVEVSIFRDDIRVATTIIDEVGNSPIGTSAPKHVSETVLAGNDFTDRIEVFGQDIISKYIPISDINGNSIGMLFVGRFLTDRTAMVNSFIAMGLVVTIIFLAAIFLLLLFVSEHVSSPIKKRLELIHYDELTGIYNRRFFDENIKRIIKSLSRSGGIISLMLVDIDCFKKFNDTYGHKSGDDCLQNIAHALASSIMRADDFVARYGGEEFIAVLPNTEEDGARAVAERMLENIRKCNIPHETSESSDIVTVSAGLVTGYPEFTFNENDFIKRADEMLYQSKQNGKNQYTFSSMSDSHHTSLSSARKALETLTQKKKTTDILNEIAFMFLSRRKESIQSMLTTGIRVMVDSVNVDEISIWRHREKSDGMQMSQIYRWTRDAGDSVPITADVSDIAYADYAPDWAALFENGESINSPVRLLLEQKTVATLSRYGFISIFATPIMNYNELWGFVLFADCRSDRFFDSHNSDIMRSSAFLFANAIIRDDLESRLELTQIEVEDATRTSVEFLTRMNHELLTPMNAIIGITDILKRSITQNKQKNYLNEIDHASRHLLELIHNLLESTPKQE